MHSRHELAWLTERGWQAALAEAHVQDAEAIKQWQQADWPAVVRRQDATSAPADDWIALGIPLPPLRHDGSKGRVALRCRAADLARTARPVSLQAACKSAPDAWHHGLVALCADAGGFELRVYGSLAMQSLTGLRYVRAGSDLDLLFYPRDAAQLDAGVALFDAHARTLPLDGEIVFANGDAVAWKEWRDACAGDARVLVKHVRGVRLDTTAALRATLES